MTDHRRAVHPEVPRPPVRAQLDPQRTRRYRLFSAAVLLIGVGVAAAVLLGHVDHPQPEQLLIAGPLLAVGFLLSEQLSIDFDVRQISWTISFAEIPLVLGLVTVPFEVVLAAYLVAGLGVQISRHKLRHLSYHAGIMCLEVAIPYAVFYLLTSDFAAMPMWAAAALGVLTSPLVSTALGLGAMHVLGGELRMPSAARLGLRSLVVCLMNVTVGLVAYVLVNNAPWGWLLAGLLAASMVALYRAYSGLLREQRDLETLSDVSLNVARSGQDVMNKASVLTNVLPPEDPADWQAIVERIRDQLNAKRVVLHLKMDSADEVRRLVAGVPLPDGADVDRDDPILQLAGNHVRYFKLSDAADDVQEALRRRGVYEVLVVPLRGASQPLGAMEVHDRLSRWRGFGSADVRLLRTLSSHLATAMDNRRLVGRLRHHAYHDPLTGLLNRTGFREVAGDPVRGDEPCVVMRIDLDVMSGVADALGYAWGDRMVLAASRRLRDALGGEVPLARLEGGSFAALLVDRTHEQAQEIGEKLRAGLSMPYPVDKLTIEASALIGYVANTAEDGDDSLDVDTLLQRADVAVQAAHSGSDPVRGYAPSMGQIFLRRFQLVTQFRSALETGQVSVHYQPKIALPSRQVVGVEALVRWRHPEFGQLDPDEFVPAVEATGLVDALTSFVMEQGLQRVRSWLDRGLRMSAAVNLSVRNLADANFPDLVAEALRRYDVPPQLLTFELTESGVMSDPERALPVLRRLHAMGVTLAVDDFGTGYSSLAYLRQLPVDEVKIDKSFVLGMGTDLSDMAVVRAIVELGHSLGLTVVAEGVEEDSAREQLVSMGCDVAQGYLISRPLSEERFEAWLRARTIRARGLRNETVLTLVS
ncbi:MAG TPA: EAL domain-containing protein [Kutzneria sp.]|jgi:diguanylate cyclase (GGDEF)-like protein